MVGTTMAAVGVAGDLAGNVCDVAGGVIGSVPVVGGVLRWWGIGQGDGGGGDGDGGAEAVADVSLGGTVGGNGALSGTGGGSLVANSTSGGGGSSCSGSTSSGGGSVMECGGGETDDKHATANGDLSRPSGACNGVVAAKTKGPESRSDARVRPTSPPIFSSSDQTDIGGDTAATSDEHPCSSMNSPRKPAKASSDSDLGKAAAPPSPTAYTANADQVAEKEDTRVSTAPLHATPNVTERLPAVDSDAPDAAASDDFSSAVGAAAPIAVSKGLGEVSREAAAAPVAISEHLGELSRAAVASKPGGLGGICDGVNACTDAVPPLTRTGSRPAGGSTPTPAPEQGGEVVGAGRALAALVGGGKDMEGVVASESLLEGPEVTKAESEPGGKEPGSGVCA